MLKAIIRVTVKSFLSPPKDFTVPELNYHGDKFITFDNAIIIVEVSPPKTPLSNGCLKLLIWTRRHRLISLSLSLDLSNERQMSPRVLVAVVLISALSGKVPALRAPIREYAGLVSNHQAVLIDPSDLPRHISSLTSQSDDDALVEDESSYEKTSGEDLPTPSALQSNFNQKITSTRKRYPNITKIRRRYRRPLPGRRTGGWKQRTGGLAPVSASGISRLSSGGLSLVNLKQIPSLVNLHSLSTESREQLTKQKVLQHFSNSRSTTTTATTTNQPTTDFLSKWHSDFSQGQSYPNKKSSVTLSSKLIKNNLSLPTTPSTMTRKTETKSDPLVKEVVKHSEAKNVNAPTTGPPSVHDMISSHFTKPSNKTQLKKSTEDSQSHNRREVRPRLRKTTTTRAPTTVKTAPAISKKPIINAMHDSEILESIKTIVSSSAQNADYSSLKFFNGNPSPSPLDIFAGVKPIYGFKPSFPQSSSKSKSSNSSEINVPDQKSSLHADSTIPVSRIEKPLRPSIGPNAPNAGPTIIVTAPPLGQDLTLKVGHSLPVLENMFSKPSNLEIRTPVDNDIVIGRPAALIQAPAHETSVSISNIPPTLRNTEGTPMIYQEEKQETIQQPKYEATQQPKYEATQQPIHNNSPYPFWHPPEFKPIVDIIKKRYETNSEAMPFISHNSAMKLKSLIERGGVSEYFNKDHIMDYIHRDQTRLPLPYSVDRLGEPFRSPLIDRENPETDLTGQFVALSGLALLMALGGYYLFSSNPAKESREVQDPLLNAVVQARHGLELLQQGLDEYETKLIEKKENISEEWSPPENVDLHHIEVIQANIKNMWEAIQSIPSKIVNEIALNDDSPFSKVVKTFNKHLQSRGLFGAVKGLLYDSLVQSPPSSREPHRLNFQNDLSAEVSKREESEHSSFMDLFSPASLNKNAVLDILSQLISPTTNGEDDDFSRGKRAKEKQATNNQNDSEEENDQVTDSLSEKGEEEKEIQAIRTNNNEKIKADEYLEMSFLDNILKTFTQNSSKRQGQLSLLQQMAAEFKNRNAKPDVDEGTESVEQSTNVHKIEVENGNEYIQPVQDNNILYSGVLPEESQEHDCTKGTHISESYTDAVTEMQEATEPTENPPTEKNEDPQNKSDLEKAGTTILNEKNEDPQNKSDLEKAGTTILNDRPDTETEKKEEDHKGKEDFTTEKKEDYKTETKEEDLSGNKQEEYSVGNGEDSPSEGKVDDTVETKEDYPNEKKEDIVDDKKEEYSAGKTEDTPSEGKEEYTAEQKEDSTAEKTKGAPSGNDTPSGNNDEQLSVENTEDKFLSEKEEYLTEDRDDALLANQEETTTVNADYGDVLDTTETTPEDELTVAPKLVFINNLLHVDHNPDTEPPRNGAYLRNRPFKRLG
ncbi:hypothetical protein SK128_009723 [Halocaridina rubra]|uniref:Uncharacterized protein n=1 Tax=Halocaridina rubra TaxID=373956 RepID=A0AAN8WXN2_HALRR